MTKHMLDIFQVIADPSRRHILKLLSQNRMSINALAENFDMSRPAVSKHIKILNSSGFISIENIGRERYCILKQDGFTELQEWIDFFDRFWVKKLNKLNDLINNSAESSEPR